MEVRSCSLAASNIVTSQAKAWRYMFFLAVLVTVSLMALPATVLARPPQTAILRWARVDTPGSLVDRNDLRSPCEINAIIVASDGKTIYAIDIPNAAPAPVTIPGLWKSSDMHRLTM